MKSITRNRFLIFLVSAVLILSLCSVFTFAETAPEAEVTENGSSEEETESVAADANEAAAEAEVEQAEEAPAEEEEATPESPFYKTIWALLPALIAIVLALITKEVYSSLFIGILAGGLLYTNFNFEKTVNHVFGTGFIGSISDSYNVGILLFLVILGAMVSMMNKAGGSAAFGRWASKTIKTRVGAQIATVILGVLIFIDDYFNCLTVGSVMRPVTDKHNVSRSKLAYLIDATAAPVCIIAPISSWAAAVSGFAEGSGMNGFQLFIRAIPYNFYALLTILMMVAITLMKFDYGPMKTHEANALKGDIFTTKSKVDYTEDENANPKGMVIDLIIPIVVLIIACVIGMIYSGGFFTKGEDAYMNFVVAFSAADASIGLAYGSFITLILSIIYFMCRRVFSFRECMECVPAGFKAMVPAIMILVCAWTLKAMTDSLGAKQFVEEFVKSSAENFMGFLPAIIFLIAVGLSFSTGTSWGTFGILIPIVIAVFGFDKGEITFVAISACMAGAVCGDHCSPISDTTIMASAGAQCDHISHVSTQLPYALTVAGVSFVCYLIAGFVPNAFIMLPISFVLMLGTLFAIKAFHNSKQ